MAKKPDTWMPFYVGDYLADTGRLTTEQHGAYLLLILDYWRQGPPPDSDETLAAIARMPANRWKSARQVIQPYFRVVDGRWRHKRIDEELAEAQRIYGQKSDAGKASAARRWQRRDNGRDNGEDNGTVTPVITPVVADDVTAAQRRDAQSQSHSNPSGLEDISPDAEFESWYAAYPRKQGRGQALKAYRAARKKADADVLLAGIEKYRKIKPDYADWAMPATWLNGERWLDEASASGKVESPPASKFGPKEFRPVDREAIWRPRLKMWADSKTWLSSWGPKPGEPHCEAPLALVNALPGYDPAGELDKSLTGMAALRRGAA